MREKNDSKGKRKKIVAFLIFPSCLGQPMFTLGYQFDPSIRWNIVVSRFHLIDGF